MLEYIKQLIELSKNPNLGSELQYIVLFGAYLKSDCVAPITFSMATCFKETKLIPQTRKLHSNSHEADSSYQAFACDA